MTDDVTKLLESRTIHQLIDAATPEPWSWDDDDGRIVRFNSKDWSHRTVASGGASFEGNYRLTIDPADAVLIIAAVNALPGLLDRIEQLETRVDQLDMALGTARMAFRSLSLGLRGMATNTDEIVSALFPAPVEDKS